MELDTGWMYIPVVYSLYGPGPYVKELIEDLRENGTVQLVHVPYSPLPVFPRSNTALK